MSMSSRVRAWVSTIAGFVTASRIGIAILAIIHLAALSILYSTEWEASHIALALLTWGLLNFVGLVIVKRPGVSAALSLTILGLLIVLSQFKFDILWTGISFFDFLIIDQDTFAFLMKAAPHLRDAGLIAAVFAVPLMILIWRLDPFRIRRRIAATGAATCFAGIVMLSIAFPEQPWEPFQGVNHISNFARSAITEASQFFTEGWFDAAAATNSRMVSADETCQPETKPPHVIMVLDESSFDITAAPGIKVPSNYRDHFRSNDGKHRSLVVEASGGPTWYSEYNVLTGLSSRSFGRFKFYVTRIAAGRVERGLPRALRWCGYRTITLYPTPGNFLSARRFQKSTGVERFVDQYEMNAPDEQQPDSFYYEQALRMIAQEKGEAPLFLFVYLTANHFPWTSIYRPDLMPDWKSLGNAPEVDEYIRRQTMSARDHADFLKRLRRDFPGESFLLLRFGDHQPAISAKLVDPAADDAEIARRMRAFDLRYFTTYYAIDAINFKPVSMSSALERIEAPYLPLVILEAAGLPLDSTFAEQKMILKQCGGTFYSCAGGEVARRFNRLLIDAGLIKDL